jgi:hypothetical protein
MKFTFLLFLVLSCFVNSAFSSEKHPWECKEEDWDKKPQMIDGVFHSTLSIECQFSKESHLVLITFQKSYKNTFKKTEKFTANLKKEALTAFHLLFTTQLLLPIKMKRGILKSLINFEYEKQSSLLQMENAFFIKHNHKT